MLEFINSIPENIGWALVGFAICLCVMMMIKLGQTFVEMWRDWHEEETDEEEEC